MSKTRRKLLPGTFTLENSIFYNLDHVYITDVMFNGPATIVRWSDSTTTVTKCSNGDVFNKDAGIAICIMKKIVGKSGMEAVKAYSSIDSKCVKIADVRRWVKQNELVDAKAKRSAEITKKAPKKTSTKRATKKKTVEHEFLDVAE